MWWQIMMMSQFGLGLNMRNLEKSLVCTLRSAKKTQKPTLQAISRSKKMRALNNSQRKKEAFSSLTVFTNLIKS